MTPVLRAASRGDVASIAAIYGHHVTHGLASFELEPPSVDEMVRRFDAITGAGYPYLVAADGERVLGYAYASAFRTRPAYRFTVEDSVYIDPGATGHGLGRTLLRALVDACTRAGYRQMIAVIGDSANDASIGLHRACGFDRMSVFLATGFKHGRWVDTVFMQRALGEGSRSLPPQPAPA
jgi:phosphinothricin acetyltransferase